MSPLQPKTESAETSSRPLSPGGNRIGKRLIALIIVFSSLITLVLTAIQLGLDYRQQRHDLDNGLESIKIHTPGISSSVWVLDKTQTELALQALVQMPYIVHAEVEVINPHRRWSAGKESHSPHTLSRTFALTHDVLGQQETVATLKVVASLEVIYASVAKHALVILLSNALKTFLVAIFMYVAFRRIVSERLERLEQKVSTQGALLLHTPTPERPTNTGEADRGDELDAVERVFDRMSGDLHHLVDELRRSNAELQQENSERRRAEEALRASEKKLNAIFHASPVALSVSSVCNGSYRIVDVNEAWVRQFGMARAAVIGRDQREPEFWNAAGDCQAVLAAVERHGEIRHYEAVRRRGNGGASMLCELSARLFDVGSERLLLLAEEDVSEKRKIESEIRELNVSLERRVIERTEALAGQMAKVEALMQALQQKKEEAEAANIAKTRFLSSASHDLRQPMHVIGLLLGILKERLGHPDADKVLMDIQAVVETMERLFSALLDISRLDAGSVFPNVCAFPLANILRAVEKDLSVLAREKKLQFRVADTSVWVRSDPQILERIVRNLVANAIRYTPTGKVLLGCRHCGNDVRLEIHDTGIGIQAADLSHIFTEFVQLDAGGKDRMAGLGLGLSIVKRSAELLGHPLAVRSQPGKGSCFAIDLPRAIEQEHKASVPEAAAGVSDLAGTFVVFIDDDKEIRLAMGALLELWNCHAIIAASASEAVEALQEHLRLPDVIVSDYRLSKGENGVDAVTLLRAATGEDTPALIVTGEISPADQLRIEDARLALLYKPINPGRLREAIAQAIAATPGLP